MGIFTTTDIKIIQCIHKPLGFGIWPFSVQINQQKCFYTKDLARSELKPLIVINISRQSKLGNRGYFWLLKVKNTINFLAIGTYRGFGCLLFCCGFLRRFPVLAAISFKKVFLILCHSTQLCQHPHHAEMHKEASHNLHPKNKLAVREKKR